MTSPGEAPSYRLLSVIVPVYNERTTLIEIVRLSLIHI